MKLWQELRSPFAAGVFTGGMLNSLFGPLMMPALHHLLPPASRFAPAVRDAPVPSPTWKAGPEGANNPRNAPKPRQGGAGRQNGPL